MLDGSVTVSVLAFTPYAALTSLLPILIALALRRWVASAVATAAAVMLAAAVLPRAIDDGGQPAIENGRDLTVMSLNLDDGQAEPERVVRLVRSERVDVLNLVETKDGLSRLQDAGLRRVLPHAATSLRSRGGGSAVLSREPLRRLSTKDQSYLAPPPTVELGGRGGGVVLTPAHPPHPTSDAERRVWLSELRALPSAGAGPVRIVMGDLNATLDHSALRSVTARGYRDAADAVGAGLRATWHASGTSVPGLALDHVLIDRRARVRDFRVFDVAGTDHRAVVALVTLPAG